MTSFTIYELTDLELGYIFFQARDRKGLTQKEVALRSNMSEKSLILFENGNGIIKLSTIIRLCKTLDVDLKFCVSK